MSQPDPISLAVQGVEQLVSSKMNKVAGSALEQKEGVQGDEIDELTLDLSDDELLDLSGNWELRYQGYEANIKTIGERNLTYYKGRQKEGTPTDVKDLPIAGNLIWEAEETFLPAALAKNPDPVVYADNTPEGNKISSDIKTLLQYHADQLVLRSKLKLMTRQWSIYHLGVIKHGWDEEIHDIKSEVRDIRNFIFNPKACVDVYGDMKDYIGERITVPASRLIQLFPKHKDFISLCVDDKMGTDVTYTEWWTDKFCFYTYKDKVLDKHKNQYFIYPEEQEADQFGNVRDVLRESRNHFARPKKPYTFLSVYSLGAQPHDITGLIEQNIPNQNLITRRIIQIDRNLQRANNSIGLSAANFNQQTGKQAAGALESGDPVLIPPSADGKVDGAIARFPAPAVPDAFFKELETNKEALRSSFGVEGITSNPPTEDETARGMILKQQFDNSRIGGGIGDALAQVADNVFNWWTQLYYVFYDEPHYAAIMGQMKAVEYVQLSALNFNKKVIVSVAADSMKPKDELTIMNQAMTLYQTGAIDPKTLLTVLNFPNPDETTEQLMLFKTNPALYIQLNFPELGQQLQQAAQAQLAQQAPGGAAPPVPPTGAPSTGEAPASASLSQVPLPK